MSRCDPNDRTDTKGTSGRAEGQSTSFRGSTIPSARYNGADVVSPPSGNADSYSEFAGYRDSPDSIANLARGLTLSGKNYKDFRKVAASSLNTFSLD
jgi:hypothetical protein